MEVRDRIDISLRITSLLICVVTAITLIKEFRLLDKMVYVPLAMAKITEFLPTLGSQSLVPLVLLIDAVQALVYMQT